MELLTYLSLVKRLWKTVVELVVIIEHEIPDEGSGSKKLDAFDVLLKGAIDRADDFDEPMETIAPVAHNIVTAVVALFKATRWPATPEE